MKEPEQQHTPDFDVGLFCARLRDPQAPGETLWPARSIAADQIERGQATIGELDELLYFIDKNGEALGFPYERFDELWSRLKQATKRHRARAALERGADKEGS